MDFVSGELLQEEMERARSFAKEGRFEEALESYMRVFEDGRQYSPFVGVRLSYCLSETAELGRVYKPAMEKLIELRNAHEASMCSGNYSLFSLQEWDAQYQKTGRGHAALITHASRAGATTRAQKLLTEAKTRLSESQLQVIRDLQKKLNL